MYTVSFVSPSSSCGRTTIALNSVFALIRRGTFRRILVLDFNYGDIRVAWWTRKYGSSLLTTESFLEEEVSLQDVLDQAITIQPDWVEGDSWVKIIPSPQSIKPEYIGRRVDDQRARLLLSRVREVIGNEICDCLVLLVPSDLENFPDAFNCLSVSQTIFIVTNEKPWNIELTKARNREMLSFLNTRPGIILNQFFPPLLHTDIEIRMKELEKEIRLPILCRVPFHRDISTFDDNGIYYYENALSGLEMVKVFDHLAGEVEKFITADLPVATSRWETHTTPKPLAIFVAEADSGRTIFTFFFGKKSEDQMKRAHLVTGAMISISTMVSETAGQKGDLRLIDNGNIKILLSRGSDIMGILYARQSGALLNSLLSQFVEEFEGSYMNEIKEFKQTGKINLFSNAQGLVRKVFSQFELVIETVMPELADEILAFALENDLDKDQAFKDFIEVRGADPEQRKLLEYEYLTEHSSRHKLLQNAGIIIPQERRNQIEGETGKRICECAGGPTYIQIQSFDVLTLLSLPDSLRPTVRAIIEFPSQSEKPSAETIAAITKREIDIEVTNLHELEKLGFIRSVEKRILL